MKCHYELLEVTRDADDDTLKKSYRKLALKWHPDKNPPERKEECTQYFALLQQAYDVLNDPHERAFYDKYRESILKGGFGTENYTDKSVNLFQYFTSSCFNGFQGPKNFFEVYSGVFFTLAEEDYEYLDDPNQKYPLFGNANSDYNTVVGPFYGFWSSFCTARSFHWLDKFDIREADNRYQARIIEAENKKVRDAGRTARNEQIRELVAFVRKRDPRVKLYREELERKNLEAKKKQEENRINQLKKNQELYGDIEAIMEQNQKHFETLLAEHDVESMEESDEVEEGIPFCIVCNKSFKSENALETHKNSKQHKKQYADLMKHMKEEDKAIFEEEIPNDNAVSVPEKKGKKAKRRAKKKKAWDEESSSSENEKDDTASTHPEEPFSHDDPVVAIENNHNNGLQAGGKVKKSRRADKKTRVTADNDEENESVGKRTMENHGNEPSSNSNKITENIIRGESFEEDSAPRTGMCDKCGEFFESRTKLFHHIRLTGHATIKNVGDCKNIKKVKKGKPAK